MAFGGSFNNMLKGLSGTSEMKYGESLYDKAEAERWKGEKNKLYGEFGDKKSRYGEQADKFLGQYGKDRGTADKYFGKADSSFGRAQSDIGRARTSQQSANALMGDRQHYANLKQRSEDRRQSYANARLEQESLAGRVGRTDPRGAFTQTLMDAFKVSNDSNREMLGQRVAQLSKTNPVAAAKMQSDFDTQSVKALGKAQQQGFMGQQSVDLQNLAMESGLLMKGTGLLGNEAQEDAMLAQYQQTQIGNHGNAASGALNAAGAEGNVARGYTGLGGQYSQRAGQALGAAQNYEGMGYNALRDQNSIANANQARQDKFQMSDMNAKARVDSFNNQRAQMGFSNLMKVASTATGIYGKVAQAGLNSAMADSLNGEASDMATSSSPTSEMTDASYTQSSGEQHGRSSTYTQSSGGHHGRSSTQPQSNSLARNTRSGRGLSSFRNDPGTLARNTRSGRQLQQQPQVRYDPMGTDPRTMARNTRTGRGEYDLFQTALKEKRTLGGKTMGVDDFNRNIKPSLEYNY